MKIYSSQLVMSLVYRSTIKATTTAQRDAVASVRLSLLCAAIKKGGAGRAVYFIVVQERQSLNLFFLFVF